ncbi:ATP-binding cassette domain-containing protein [Enterococcus sp. BWB1-3]|uniref:ATP-binding cassette domain-containing protein n=1 Tax=unclassified Enterococcus TaxID=2608891 RepID=UPI0019205C38|nr:MULTISPECIES: ATP-binding cassette domain-containing protein [unclassified Enterococcus]MBL1230331.1 ATP-binding cassette domain-containing protein [Enterococcus sp. BWB1-3]MCB5951360.1 ATP-binding cassette domain-containing protein [Enterococcus sp. BWT-B8]
MINLNNVSINYSKKIVINNFNLQLFAGDIVGFVAPNGSGKTTLLRAIAGLKPLRSGTIEIEKNSILDNREQFLKKIFYVESTSNLFDDLTVKDHLLLIKEYWKSPITLNEAVKLFETENYLDKKINELSLGMKQHVILSMYLISNCDILLLDEPLNGLDPTSISIINTFFIEQSKKGKIIFFSSHNLFNIEAICNKVVFLHEKKELCISTADSDISETYHTLFNGGSYEI